MSASSQRKLTPSVVIAIMALALALVGGTAVAAPLTAGQVKSIVKKQINKRAPKLLVKNADTVDGFHANQLARATTAVLNTSIDGFDAGVFTNTISRSVTAPVNGIFVITGQMNVNRDTDDPDPTLVNVRGAVDGAAATAEANVRATEDGVADQSVSVYGAFPVTAGAHTVSLQAIEVGAGQAFITERSISVVFVPFGNDGAQGVVGKLNLKPSSGANR